MNITKSQELLASSYNTREDKNALRVARGSILASDGTVLAETRTEGDSDVRSYPYGSLFAHIVGYPTRGRAGVEASANKYLSESNINIKDKILNELKDEKNPGDNVVTTLDVDLQRTVSEAFGSNKGAVVILEPSTGKILAMVSTPSFDPNNVDELWDTFEDSELYNKATQGQYAPGSTFKIVTALAYIQQNPNAYENFTHKCTGSITYGEGKTIKCANGQVHGSVNFSQAFAKSCNTAFAKMAQDMDAAAFKNTAESLMFNTDLPYSLGARTSNFPVSKDSSLGQRMMSSIGQAEVTASPLHMAMLAAAIANNGTVMEPYVMESVVSADGEVIKDFSPVTYKAIMSAEEASLLRGLMSDVVSSGTGSKLQTDQYEVVGKTGTAEYNNNKNDTHSWFVGYADKNGKQIAIAVIAEGAGSGSEVAVPIAKQIFDAF